MSRNLLFFVGFFFLSAAALGAKEEAPFQFITLEGADAVFFEDQATPEKKKQQPILPTKKVKRKVKKQREQVELAELNSKTFAPQENNAVKDEEALLEQNIAPISQDLYQPAANLVESTRKEEPKFELEIDAKDAFITSSAQEEDAVFSSFNEELANELLPEKAVRKKDVKALAKAHSVEKVLSPHKTAPVLEGGVEISFAQVFAGSPIIYSILLSLSIFALCVCLYNLLGMRSSSETFIRKIRQKLMSNQFDEALSLCLKDDRLFARVVAAAISVRKHGLPHMLETMKTEGKRATVGFWQRIALLNDIAIVAPMLGLLGTVLGMFYAFYDLNRSRESVNTLFDGLGISVGTTVAGLAVAIIAMMLHSFAKYRLVRVLATAEEEAQSLAALMEAKPSFPGEKL